MVEEEKYIWLSKQIAVLGFISELENTKPRAISTCIPIQLPHLPLKLKGLSQFIKVGNTISALKCQT